MDAMMRRLHEIHCTALHAYVLLGVLLPGAATAVAPRLEVQARIDNDSGEVVQRSVAPGAVLRSGDEVRLRVTAWKDGYLYVVALGSSGAAVLLHPFTGPAEPVRAGEELAVPRDGGFLPLDSRTGREHVLAFVSDTPLESLARLLVRLEGAGAAADADSLRELMSSEGFEAAHLVFGHRSAELAVAPVPVAETLSTEAAMVPPRAGAVRTDGAAAAVMSDAGLQAAAADAPAAAPDTTGPDAGKSGGWLAGLGAFFRGGGEPAPTAEAPPATPEGHQPRLGTGREPTLSRRVDESGRSVVMLDGAAPPLQRDSEVLSGSGSRIRALLDEPEPPRTAAVPAPAENPADRPGHVAPGIPAQASPAQAPSPAPPAVAATQPTVSAVPDAAPPATTSLETAPSLPAIPVVPRDPVPGAPAPGAAVAGSELTAQVALLAATPARAVEQSAARLAQVDLSGNAGAAAAVVMVVTPEGATSGVLVNERGHVLTNWHSVRAYDAVQVLFKQAGGTGPAAATRSRARLVAHSKFSDLALLQVDSLPAGIAPPVLVSRVEVDGGAPLHAIGPGADGHWRHSVATLDRIRRNSSWYSTRRVLHRADVVRAEMADPLDVAGVPLFNDALELVGLGAMSRNDKGELIGISAGTLRAFLAAAGG